MKLSFVTFVCPDWELEKVVEQAANFGYAGVEFRCDAGHAHGVEIAMSQQDRIDVRYLLQQHDVQAVCLATSIQLITPQAISQAKARIELASDIGCKAVRVFCGVPPESQAPWQTIKALTKRLKELAQIAQDHGIQVWLKMHDAMAHGADAAQVLQEVVGEKNQHSNGFGDAVKDLNVGISYDCLHSYRMGEDLVKGFDAVKPYLKHACLHDGLEMPDRVEIKPMGEGDLPIRKLFELFKGFEGYVCGEWFYNQYGSSVEGSLARFASDIRDFRV